MKSIRRFSSLLAPAFLLACAQSPPPAVAVPAPTQRWLATWTAPQAPAPPRPPADSADGTPTYSNRTVREIVHTSIGGDRVRIRVSNEYGDQPLIIDAAHVAARDTGDAIVIATDRALTFGGRPSLMLRPGATAVSDAVPFNVPATSDLAVSLHLAAPARLATRHGLAMQRSYVSPDGDFTAAPVFTAESTTSTFPFLAGVDVVNDRATGVIVALGNSITDGARSTSGTNSRWPDILARRLLASPEPPKGVANAGISGNRVLTFGTGPSALPASIATSCSCRASPMSSSSRGSTTSAPGSTVPPRRSPLMISSSATASSSLARTSAVSSSSAGR